MNPSAESPRQQNACSLGVTEGTRTPDLQGHNLGDVTGEKCCRPWERESDLRSALLVADAGPMGALDSRRGRSCPFVASDRSVAKPANWRDGFEFASTQLIP